MTKKSNGADSLLKKPMRGSFCSVTGPDGNILTLANLPATDTKRWVCRRKAELVAAVRDGLLSFVEVCERYRLSSEEFLSWQDAQKRYGLRGLCAASLREYRAI